MYDSIPLLAAYGGVSVALTPRLDSAEALYAKLSRELYRAFHHPSPLHKADHLYNFCITAHSLRDYLLERLGKVSEKDKQPFIDRWAREPLLVAVSDIANTAKHFQLRNRRTQMVRTARAKAVRPGRSTYANVYMSATGELRVVNAPRTHTYYITLEDGTKHELFAFMSGIERYWKSELRSHGLKLRTQSFRSLAGPAT